MFPIYHRIFCFRWIKHRSLLFFFALSLFLVGCRSSAPKKERVYPVSVTEVVRGDVSLYLHAVGYVYPPDTYKVRPQVRGTLVKAHVAEGDKVKKGQLLFSIDNRTYVAAVEQAKSVLKRDEASLGFAIDRRDRNQHLVKDEYISAVDYDQLVKDVAVLQAQVQEDQASLKKAEIDLGYCEIASPIDGLVGPFYIYPGNYVTPADTSVIAEVRDLLAPQIVFGVSQADFAELLRSNSSLGKTSIRFTPSGTDLRYDGRVLFYDNTFDEQTGTVLLRAVLEAKEGERIDLLSSVFGKVQILDKRLLGSAIVPEAALQRNNENTFFFVLQGNEEKGWSVALRNVEILGREEGQLAVGSGLKVGEKVVVRGQINLRDGSKVMVIPSGDRTQEAR